MKIGSWTLILLWMLPLVVAGQSSNLILGHDEFKQLNYHRAILAYEAASDKNLRAYRNLAQCYLAMGHWEHARRCMAKVCASDEPLVEDLWNYAQILMRIEHYGTAEKVLASMYAKAPRDMRALAYRNAGEQRSMLRKVKAGVRIAYQGFNSEELDFGLALHQGQLVFTSTRHPFSLVVREWDGNQSNFLNLYTVDPAAPDAKPKYYDKTLNGQYHEGPIAFSGDGHLRVVTRTQYHNEDENGIRNLGLFMSKFDGVEWSPLTPFPHNDSTYSIGHATLNTAGDVMYFVSDMPGGAGGKDIWRSVFHLGNWQKPEPVYSVNTEGNEMFPYLLEEAGILLFASDGHVGLGGLDIFAAKQKDGQYYKIRNLGRPINSSADDFGLVMDSAMHAGYFVSDRTVDEPNIKRLTTQDTLALLHDDDIYSVTFETPFSFGKIISGLVTDDNGDPVEGAELTLLKDQKAVKTITTPADGQYEFAVDSTGLYSIVGNKPRHFEAKVAIRVDPAVDDYELAVKLRRDPQISIRLVVTDSEYGEPMEGVNLTITDLITGETVDFQTTANGAYSRRLPEKTFRDTIAYRITLRMQDHLTRTLTYGTRLQHFGAYEIHKAKVNGRLLDFGMKKKTVGDDLSLQLGLQPYFFESDPAGIKMDTTGDLNAIADVMRENPGLKIEVVSHTDCKGAAEDNQKLSELRASLIAAYLQKQIPDGKARITSRGMGEQIPKSGCLCEGNYKCTPEEYQIDRRTDFIIKGI